MLIFVDKHIPDPAKIKLSFYGEVIDFETKGIVYESISCHPDIFFCQTPDTLIVSPDCPEVYFKLLNDNNILHEIGEKHLSATYPNTAHYNAVFTEKYFVHNLKHTDNKIIESVNSRAGVIKIDVKQAYTRCNLVVVKDIFLTSDKGVFLKLKTAGEKTFYVDPSNIFLTGFKNGFFGGCCGTFDDKLFVIGTLRYIIESKCLTDILSKNNIELVELYDGRLFDGGGVLFVS
jgi:hypothetical protein